MKRALYLLLVVGFLQTTLSAAADPTHEECTGFYLNKCSSGTATSAAKKLERNNKVEFRKTLTLPGQSFERADACKALVSISYMQMNEKVRVDTTVVNEDCVVSSGGYTLLVRTIDDEGEVQTRNITESWARNSAAPIELTQDYDLGINVGLLSVKVRTSRKTLCACNGGELADSGEVE